MYLRETKPIYVTQPSLPSIEDYSKILSEVFDSGVLTHHGSKVQQLERDFKSHYNIESDPTITSNGTLAIQLALRTLDKPGKEIITTPFSFIATISSILWEYYKPVFVDIDPTTFNIDADKIASKIPTLIPSTPNALTSFPIDSRLDILILGFGNYSE
jgi:dTDP-4-amino-4,6-dideoxygalactose transaminase